MLKTLYKEDYYHSKINDEVCKKSFDFINKTNNSYKEKSWNCKIRTSFNVTDNILNCTELHELKLNIQSHIENFMHLRNNYFNGYIFNSWINIYEKDFYQEEHIHSDDYRKYLSGVVYLSDNNSNLNLHSQHRSNIETNIQPQFADIIIFNDDCPHSVSPNQNEDLRISLAFNYLFVSKWKGMFF
jgi:hypothetical protein